MVEPRIIYEDKNFLVLDKPAGLLVHQVRISNIERQRPEEPTLVDWLLEKYPELEGVGDSPELRPGIVHRLDRATSGVMLIAKNNQYFYYLKSLFKERKIKKYYLALVLGLMKNKKGIIDQPIGIKTGTIKRTSFSDKMKKEAVTRYELIERLESSIGEFSLLKIFPETGRTHQIRVHLAGIGHPVVGDPIYGGARNKKLLGILGKIRLMLHAISLDFSLSPGKRIKIESPTPPNFVTVISKIKSKRR